MALERRQVVPSPPQPTSRWPGLVAAVGGEAAISTFTASNAGDDDNTRWERGLTFVPNTCPIGTTPLDPCEQAPFTYPVDACDNVENAPLIFWTAKKLGTKNVRLVEDEVKADLIAQTSHKLETEFLLGTGAQAYGYPSQYLTDGNATVVSSTPVPAKNALGVLAQAAGVIAQGQRLVLWVPPAAASMSASEMTLRKESGLLLDPFDNVVVAGTGITGAGPGVAADDTYSTMWAFATTTPAVRLSEVRSISTVDQTNNTKQAIAWRVGSVSIDPCVQLAIEIDLCNVNCDGAPVTP